MSAFSTSCPNCGAAFIVTPQQLAIANGSVRCGSCMHIFVAAQHRADNQPKADNNIFDFKLTETDTAAPSSAQNKVSTSGTKSEFSDQFLNLNSEQQLFTDADDDDSNPADDEQWAKNLLADLEDDDSVSISPALTQHATPPAAQDDIEAILSPELMELENDLSKPQATDRTQQIEKIEQPTVDATTTFAAEPDSERRRMLSSIQAEPLEFTFRRFHWSQVLSRTAYSLACLIALGGLAAQYAWFNRDQLARDDRYRPWYELACTKLQCTLPERDDVSLIQASNLVVRSHPTVAKALVVDALLTNRATFEQAFPDLELVFTDMQGKIVAARRLKPAEYQSQKTPVMPAGEPIHLALEIVDPGPTATGYRIIIHRHNKA